MVVVVGNNKVVISACDYECVVRQVIKLYWEWESGGIPASGAGTV